MGYQYDLSADSGLGLPATYSSIVPLSTGDYFHITIAGSGPPVTERLRVVWASGYQTATGGGSVGALGCEGVSKPPPPPPP